MSLLPVMLRSMGWQLRQHNELMRHFLRQDMKGFFSPEEIKFLSSPFPSINFMRTVDRVSPAEAETPQTIINKDEFKLQMDVQDYEPDEVTVKTIDKTVVIEAKHEERPDENGLVARQFVRKYTVPEGYNIKDLVSTLSADGILTVRAPSLQQVEANNERIVKIEQTADTHRKVKEPEKNEKLKKEEAN